MVSLDIRSYGICCQIVFVLLCYRYLDLTEEEKEKLKGSYKVARKLEKLENLQDRHVLFETLVSEAYCIWHLSVFELTTYDKNLIQLLDLFIYFFIASNIQLIVVILVGFSISVERHSAESSSCYMKVTYTQKSVGKSHIILEGSKGGKQTELTSAAKEILLLYVCMNYSEQTMYITCVCISLTEGWYKKKLSGCGVTPRYKVFSLPVQCILDPCKIYLKIHFNPVCVY